jgi:hypothetical protein
MSSSGRQPWDANDPYPDDGDDLVCDHEDYEADIITGIATCPNCGHWWIQTAEEIEREHYTGNAEQVFVTYILTGGQFGIEPGHIVMGVKSLAELDQE